MEKPEGWVYFIRATESGWIKIGYTAGDPLVRMAALQTGNHEALELIVAIRAPQAKEKELHRRFAAHNTRGEWFKPDPLLIGFVDALKWSSDFDRYEPPLTMPATAFGLCEDQVRVIVGYMEARRLFDAADEAHEHFKGRGKLDPDEVHHLVKLRVGIERLLGRIREPEDIPEDAGLSMFGGISLAVSLDRVNEALANHGAADTDERIAEDAGRGVAPWECEEADALFAHELDDMDWSPAPAKEWN